MTSNNPPYAELQLTQNEYEFLLKNCESNMAYAIRALQDIESISAATKLVELNESFKSIKQKLLDARRA